MFQPALHQRGGKRVPRGADDHEHNFAEQVNVGSPRSANKICIVTPVPPRVGGVGVLGALLADLLRSEGLTVNVISSVPEIPKLLEILPVVRPLSRYSIFLYKLLRDVREGDVIHHLTASGRFFYLSAPVIWIGHWRKCRVIVNYHGANAEKFWRDSAKWAVPLLKKADVSMVASPYI